ncbi:MAG TPA: PQQ-binding-like beta-propeller repeat protein [Steroidobacteraceae bacterium]|nr:PQQ-binding-like beta-propeller repeat protein [Steroidobacteraceae bacterium]
MSRTTRRVLQISCVAGLLAACVPLAAESDGSATPRAATTGDITPAPAFTPTQLTALPSTGWPTNGGNLYNQRYSALTQLNRANVKELKAVWRASLGGSGLGSQTSGQGQMLEYAGVLYVVTGEDDVFAIDVDTGRVLWEHRARLDPNQVLVCCGWDARGLGLGDGKVFVGQLDNWVVALDQKTGNVVWRTQSHEPGDGGSSITMAPLYYDGMVIVGHSGGEEGIRGVIRAYDARTGKPRWHWYTVPAPGEPGSETWPKGSDIWKIGGGGVWSTPAVDPELGLLYLTVANPAPDLNGHVRAGDNLYTSSIVALDVKTGKYRWHFQDTHHDIWDYGGANPIVLFDVNINGQPRKGLSHAPKSGYVYILDRVTGKPLVGIEERPVPQNASQNTSRTQPIPTGDDVVPHSIDAALETGDLVNEGRTFTPFDEKPVLYKQLAGINWPPMSYDVQDHVLYICANDGMGTVKRNGEQFTPPPRGQAYLGGSFGRGNMPRRGLIAAEDVTTQKLIWRRQWPDPCNSGFVSTAGGLLFGGRADGRVMAFDTHDGSPLWEWQLDASIGAPVTTFEHKGEQVIAVYAGGYFFGGIKRGDGVWLFSRKGTLQQATPFARGSADGGTAPAVRVVSAAGGDAAAGKQTFERNCTPCHGENGKGGHAEGAVLSDNISAQTVMTVATTGRKEMPSFRQTLSEQQLRDVAAYASRLLAK